MSAIIFSGEVYRWLVSLEIMGNQGTMNDNQQVTIPQASGIHFESGWKIGEMVGKILSKAGQRIPICLSNIKQDTSKTTKITNWNFIWLSFEDLRMQFDNRIKDLILQGEITLIGQIIKQLYERDEHKDEALIKSIVIRTKHQKELPNNHKASLDFKKFSSQRNPEDADSSLEFLVILLSSSLNMPTEEILGLFTNQNKFMAHIIAKGINEDFSGIILFYTLLDKYSHKLNQMYQLDKNDTQSCLYAIKPGFISKSDQVSTLAISLFSKIGGIYEWFVSEEAKGAMTLLLGIKRHPHLVDEYWRCLLVIIKGRQQQFFEVGFKRCFKEPFELIQLCLLIAKPLSEGQWMEKLHEGGIIDEWLEIGYGLFDGGLEYKTMAYKFVGEMMLRYPKCMEGRDHIWNILKRGWKECKMNEFIVLLDEVLTMLEKLTASRNVHARKIYQVLIEIVEICSADHQKTDYVIYNFIEVLPKLPAIPTQHLLTANHSDFLTSAHYSLARKSIDQHLEWKGVIDVGYILLRVYLAYPLANGYLGPMIHKCARKAIHEEEGVIFIKKVVKDSLQIYSSIEIKRTIAGKSVVALPMYLNKKGNDKRVNESETEGYFIKDKEASNLLQLVEKLIGLSLQYNNSLTNTIRDELMGVNAFIKQNNYKTGSKAISNLLSKKFGVTPDQQNLYHQNYKTNKSNHQQSIRKKVVSSSVFSKSKAPEHLQKQLDSATEKRKKEQEARKSEEDRKAKEELIKKNQIKKQIQRINLLKGFGGETELKEEGFWSKIIKDSKDVQLYHPSLIEPRDLEYIDNLFKRYHRVVRSLFLKYTTTMFTSKSINSFDDQQQRTQTISCVELVKFLKDYNLYFLTSSNDVQVMTREINVKLLNRRQTQDLDYGGFQLFLTQFSIINMTKSHSVNIKTGKGQIQVNKNYWYLSHWQLVQEFFNYLKMVFEQRGEPTTLFDEPQSAYFNESELIKEFNKKLDNDPRFILPQGYKKVTEKIIKFIPKVSENIIGIKKSYQVAIEVLDEILSQSFLKIHFLQPTMLKQLKARVKPQQFVSIKPKIKQQSMETIKPRALSTANDKKIFVPPPKMLEKKDLTLGMKLGLSYISYRDKLLGEQVAYVIDDMIDAVENNRTTINKDKKTNQILRKRKQVENLEKKQQQQKEKKRKQRKIQLQKLKNLAKEKKQKQQLQNKQQNQKKRKKQQQIERRRKQEQEKFLQEKKKLLQEKKQKQEQKKLKLQEQQARKKQQQRKNKQKFNQFNKKQIQKLKLNFQEGGNKRKLEKQSQQENKKNKQQMYKKLRNKIQSQDKKIQQIKEQTKQKINQLYHSQPIVDTFKIYEPNLRAVYDFLIKNTYLSLTQRKHNNQIIFQTWNYFTQAFQISPLILDSKDAVNIFKQLTKEKQVNKQYYLGLNYSQFQQALLRCAIKHKSVFNKLAQKIKQQKMTEKQIQNIVQKDIEQKQKNEFDQQKQIDVKNLLKQQDINKQVFYDYGDINKVNERTLKGLIFYIKVPKDKAGQQKRFREILNKKIKKNVINSQQLKEKFNEQYSLNSPIKKKTKKNIKNITNLSNSQIDTSQIKLQTSIQKQQQQIKQQEINK